MRLMMFFATTFFLFSCQNSIDKKKIETLEQKYDSIKKISDNFINSNFYKFHKIYLSEKNTVLDTLLIDNYKEILSKDELVNTYIWSRIHTINKLTEQNEIKEKIAGNYKIKPTYNSEDGYVSLIRIENDSCFLYQKKLLVASAHIKFAYSRNEFTIGKFRVGNFYISLIEPDLAIIKNNSCVDCEELQFYKAN